MEEEIIGLVLEKLPFFSKIDLKETEHGYGAICSFQDKIIIVGLTGAKVVIVAMINDDTLIRNYEISDPAFPDSVTEFKEAFFEAFAKENSK